MFDPVPWLIGGGALHSPETARNAIYISTQGAEGVTAPTGLRVAALSTPGTSIRVLPGSALVLNRSVGGGEQTYTVRAGTETNVAIAAQGAGGTRYDLIVARVEDPWMAGTPWADPTDATVGPYVFPRVISNVPAGTTSLQQVAGYANDSGIALARIAVPASTATITDAMITDLRKVAQPKRQRDLYNTQPSAVSSLTGTAADWTTQANRTIAVPAWASQVKVVGTLAGVVCRTAAAVGNTSFMLGTLGGAGAALDMDLNTRATLVTSDTLAIPVAVRGTSVVLKLRGNRSSGTGTIQTDTYSTVLWDVEFLEVASAD